MSDVAGTIVHPPVFEPSTALGWRDVALDGLSCYLRCVEAALRAHGYEPAQVADALALPLRLIGSDPSGTPFGAYPGCRIEWQRVEPGVSLWDELWRIRAAGELAVLSPDSYWWPGDELQGRLHGHHHMVLPIARDAGVLEMLDTDAPADTSFRRSLPVDDALRLAVNTIGRIRVRPAQDVRPFAAEPDAALAESLGAVSADLSEFRLLTERWQAEPPTPMLARALHVFFLGEVQPPLFVFASALASLTAPRIVAVREAAFVAAGQAKKLGILLTGLHRFDSAALYRICWAELDAFTRALEALSETLSASTGSPLVAPGAPRRLGARLSGIARWCFDQSGEEAVRWLAAPC
jgi:hypothetical protein